MSDYVNLRAHTEKRLRLIEENVRDYAMFVVDPEGRIASWNLGAERILGYTETEAVGMNCARIFTPEDRAHGAPEMECEIARTTGRAEDERWHLRKSGTRFWGSGVMTALKDDSAGLVGYVKILRDETARKEADEERAKLHRRRIEQERQNAVLKERNRIAQEIHDTLAQSLTAISIQLEAAKDVLPADLGEALASVDRAQELARTGLTEARRSVWALRPQILERGTLVSALTRLAEETRTTNPILLSYSVEGLPALLPHRAEDHLLRIAQEAVTNALRHSHATELKLRLSFGADSVAIQVEDNGRGFDVEEARDGFGLKIMGERTELIGGRWRLESRQGHGTLLEVVAPVWGDAAPQAEADSASWLP